jgi:hypothetical protein
MLQALSKKHNSFVRPLKKKGFKEERVTTMGLYAIGKSTTLESNKSPSANDMRGFIDKNASKSDPLCGKSVLDSRDVSALSVVFVAAYCPRVGRP